MTSLAATRIIKDSTTRFGELSLSLGYRFGPTKLTSSGPLAWARPIAEVLNAQQTGQTQLTAKAYTNFKNSVWEHVQAYQTPTKTSTKSALVQFSIREMIQASDLRQVPTFEEMEKILANLPPGSWVELNGLKQIDSEGEFTKSLILACVQRGLRPCLHAGASLNLVQPTIDFLRQTAEVKIEDQWRKCQLKDLVILKVYARVEKFDPQELTRILQTAINAGLDPANIRVGLEHLLSLLYNGQTQPGRWTIGGRQSLGILEQMLTILQKFGVTRLSGPETRGIAKNPAIVYGLMSALLDFLQARNFSLTSWEAHCHDDFGQADQNTLAIIKAIADYNQKQATNIQVLADTSGSLAGYGGLGERTGICRLEGLTQAGLLDKPNQQALQAALQPLVNLPGSGSTTHQRLRAYTAGTHLDLIWNKIQEFLAIITQDQSWRHQTIYHWLRNSPQPANPYKHFQRLLHNPPALITAMSLHVYGQALVDGDQTNNLEPFVPLHTPVLGKRNLLFRLVLEGFNLAGPSPNQQAQILRFIRRHSPLTEFSYDWHRGLEGLSEQFFREMKTRAKPRQPKLEMSDTKSL